MHCDVARSNLRHPLYLEVEDKSFFHQSVVLFQFFLLALLFRDEGTQTDHVSLQYANAMLHLGMVSVLCLKLTYIQQQSSNNILITFIYLISHYI